MQKKGSFNFKKSFNTNDLQKQGGKNIPSASHTHKKCDANCDAFYGDAHHFSSPPRLWLRNRIFYCIIELPRVNGKRRYCRISLHTNNYYEAREKIRYMAFTYPKEIEEKMKLLRAVKPFASLEELIKYRDEYLKKYNQEVAAANSILLLYF